MRGLDDFFKSDQQIAWEDFDLVNRKRSESILNLSNLYFKLFYNRNIHYMRPKAFQAIDKQPSESCNLRGTEKLNIGNYLPKDVTLKTKELLTSLNYIFSQQINAAAKTIKKINSKQLIDDTMRREETFWWTKDSQLPTDCSSDD